MLFDVFACRVCVWLVDVVWCGVTLLFFCFLFLLCLCACSCVMDVCALCGKSCATLYVVLWVVLCVTRLFNACVCL